MEIPDAKADVENKPCWHKQSQPKEHLSQCRNYVPAKLRAAAMGQACRQAPLRAAVVADRVNSGQWVSTSPMAGF